jgi:hypothetical protein
VIPTPAYVRISEFFGRASWNPLLVGIIGVFIGRVFTLAGAALVLRKQRKLGREAAGRALSAEIEQDLQTAAALAIACKTPYSIYRTVPDDLSTHDLRKRMARQPSPSSPAPVGAPLTRFQGLTAIATGESTSAYVASEISNSLPKSGSNLIGHCPGRSNLGFLRLCGRVRCRTPRLHGSRRSRARPPQLPIRERVPDAR